MVCKLYFISKATNDVYKSVSKTIRNIIDEVAESEEIKKILQDVIGEMTERKLEYTTKFVDAKSELDGSKFKNEMDRLAFPFLKDSYTCIITSLPNFNKHLKITLEDIIKDLFNDLNKGEFSFFEQIQRVIK